MTKIGLNHLIWDEWNKEHIKKHKVTQAELKEAVARVSAHRGGYSGRIVLIGRSGKRILAIVLEKEKTGYYYINTARDADKKERRLLYDKEKENNS